MISHPTGERKPQAKACGYRFLSKESLNLERNKAKAEVKEK